MVWRRLPAVLLACALFWVQSVPVSAGPEGEVMPLTVDPAEIVAALQPHQTSLHRLQLDNHSDRQVSLAVEVAAGDVESLGEPVIEYQVLVVASPGSPQADSLALLVADIEHVVVSLWPLSDGTPTADDLAAYDVVVVGNRILWETGGISRDSLGNALADYVDIGGKVIDTLLIQSGDSWGLTGRFIADGYAPVTISTGSSSSAGGVTLSDVEHPLLQSVSALHAPTYLLVAARPGVEVPAVIAGTEIPFVAANEQVVFINAQLLDDRDDGDMAALLGNAIRYLCGERTPWLTVEPTMLDIAPGTSAEVAVRLDSKDLEAPAVHEAEIHFRADDLSELVVPVELAIAQGAEIGRVGGIVTADRPQEPLEGIQIEITSQSGAAGSTRTDAAGAFRFWLPPDDYTLSVDLGGYLPYAATLSVPAGVRINQDIALICDAPWLWLAPERIIADGDASSGTQCSVQIGNDGVQPLHWALETGDLPAWLTLPPTGDELAPGESASFDVSIDIAQAPPGWSVSDVPLTSNDPLQSPAVLRIYVRRGRVVMLPTGSR